MPKPYPQKKIKQAKALYLKYRQSTMVARDLGLSPATVNYWRVKFGWPEPILTGSIKRLPGTRKLKRPCECCGLEEIHKGFRKLCYGCWSKNSDNDYASLPGSMGGSRPVTLQEAGVL